MPAGLIGFAGDLDQELVPDRAKHAFDLSSALRAARGGVGELDPDFHAGPQQPGVDGGAAAVDVDTGRTPRETRPGRSAAARRKVTSA
jgi:hypothetical protein